MLQTVGRAGQVLDLFSAAAPEWGATAVAHELDIAKSQAHELLVSLADIGLLQRQQPGRYRLGWRIVALNSLVVDTSDLGEEPLRVLRALGARTGETVHLAAWGPGTGICVAAFEGRELGTPPPMAVGARMPGHSTASGKVLLAGQPWEAVQDALARDGLEAMTQRTIASSERLREELAGVRRRGFAYEEQEHQVAVCGVAAPVRDLHGHVVAAVGMSLSAARWQRAARDSTRAVVAVAERCSELLRHRALDRRAPDGTGLATAL